MCKLQHELSLFQGDSFFPLFFECTVNIWKYCFFYYQDKSGQTTLLTTVIEKTNVKPLTLFMLCQHQTDKLGPVSTWHIFKSQA